ncbi:HAD-IB family hydrolase, partial [Acinetobacter baumannii]
MYATSETNKTIKNLALFDFDGTLCSKDSFTGFIFYALSKRHIVKQGLKILPWIQA